MDRSGFLSLPLFWLATLGVIGPFVSSSRAQTCGAEGVAVQVLGSGGSELQEKRASSCYLVWQDGQARVLVDAGGASALRFGGKWRQDVATRRHLVLARPRGGFANDLDCFPVP